MPMSGFIIAKKAKGLSDKTIATYQNHYLTLSKYIEPDAQMNKLTKADIEYILAGMRDRGLAANSIASYTRTLRSFLSWARAEELTTLTCQEYKTEETVKDTYTDAELRALLKKPMNNRQQKLLDAMPQYDSRIIVSKNQVNMTDLAALTAETGVEFAMFTKGGDRLIIRGDTKSVNVDVETAQKLAQEGYKWSGHTHPGLDMNAMFPSEGDKLILSCFRQEKSVIYNSKGQHYTFEGDL